MGLISNTDARSATLPASATLGYERVDEVLGKNMHDLIHHTRADGTLFPVEECRVHRVTRTGEGVHAEDEMFWRAKGTSFPVEYWSYPQRRGEEVVGAVVAFVDITERKLAEAALANVSRRLIEAHEQERTRIGRDLHDDVVQRLALLAIELEGVQQDVPDVGIGTPHPDRRTAKRNHAANERCSIAIARIALFETGVLWASLERQRTSAKSLVSARRWKLISRVTIYLQPCQPNCLFLCSEFYKKPYAMPRSIVG